MRESEKNKLLIELFPFLQAPINGSWDYSWTFIDFLPSRHRTRFIDMCWELKRIYHTKQHFYIVEVKEKYDEVRIYVDTQIDEVDDIIDAYWRGIKYYD